MSAYWPIWNFNLFLALTFIVALLGSSLLFSRSPLPVRGRWLPWLLTIFAIDSVNTSTVAQPAGLRMLLLCATMLYGMKAIVMFEEHKLSDYSLSSSRWLAFMLGWFGTRGSIFAKSQSIDLASAVALTLHALKCTVIGFVFLAIARVIVYEQAVLDYGLTQVGATVSALIGISLVFHFGFINLVAAFWQSDGINCQPLFKAPLYALTLQEFWSKRWNLAFSEMVAIAVYRPLTSKIGRYPALLVGFVFSGLLHELAVSLPVHAGYGLPMLYFILQGLAVLAERLLKQRGFDLRLHPIIGRVWLISWLVLPLPLLFHRYFLSGVIWPLIGLHT